MKLVMTGLVLKHFSKWKPHAGMQKINLNFMANSTK